MKWAVVLAMGTVGLAAACGPSAQEKREAQQAKYRSLYEAGRAIDAGVASGVNFRDFGGLLQTLTKEIMLATDRATTAEEKALIAAYSDTLSAWKDSATVWAAQFNNKWTWFENSEVTQDAEVMALVKKYQLPTTRNPPEKKGGDVFVVLHKDESLQKVWAVAGEKSKKAAQLYLGAVAP